ncbi:hypothetical protein [Nostoc sp.]|uniref:hypothetical protein n=1 Tax=Nostoc sp. TaxID=1180 RepID=UPI002FFC01CA
MLPEVQKRSGHSVLSCHHLDDNGRVRHNHILEECDRQVDYSTDSYYAIQTARE